MNEALKPYQWQPGRSGNPNGRPPSSKHRIAEAVLRDIQPAWEKHGVDALNKLAKDDPRAFVQAVVGILPKDVQLTVTERLPGGLDAEEWSIVVEIMQAVRELVPNAGERKPGDVLAIVRDALALYSAPQIDGTPDKISEGNGS